MEQIIGTIRLTKDTFESRVNVNENKTFTCKDVDGTDNDVTVLRSLSRRPKLIDECAIPQNASVHPRPVDKQIISTV